MHMRQTLLTIVVASLMGGVAQASPYTLDGSHGEVGFSVKHLMISTVKGRFNKFEGGFQFDEAKNEISNIDVKIDVASVDTNDKKRDEHLASDDFFAAKQNPTITFKSDAKAVKMTGNKAQVPGTLTIRGKSKPVTLAVEYLGATKDPWGNDKIGFTATTQINRKDFGVSWNKSLDKGGVAVADEVKIMIDGEATKVAAKK